MLSEWDMVGRLLVAALLGSFIGFERERLSWAAGLRTHMLVCVGACLAMIVSAFGFSDILGTDHVTLDPSRIAAQVVSGIGFLGAGSILMRGEVIRGLTTAASLWAVAGVGLAIGGGLYVPGIAATVIILGILAGVKPIEERYRAKTQTADLYVQATKGELTLTTLNEALGDRTQRIRQFVVQPSELADYDEITITLSRVSARQVLETIRELRKIPCVKDVREVG
jgi:putative Mg2+ transporter-C (MgtC) family protein